MNTNNNNQTTETTTTSSSVSNIQPQTLNIFTLTKDTTAQQIIDQMPNIPNEDIIIIEKQNIDGSILLDRRVTVEVLSGSLKLSIRTALCLDNLPENIFESLLPPLGEKSGSSSGSSISIHEPAKLLQKQFNCLAELPSKPSGSTLWSMSKTYDDNQRLLYSTESDIQIFVKLCLHDIIFACDMRAHCTNELGITGLRPDIMVIQKNNGLPIGVVEVKKPGSNVMENERIHGQIFNFMTRLKEMYGQKNVYGIVSTYSQWRIYWLSDNESAESTDLGINNICIGTKIEYPIDIPRSKKTKFLPACPQPATPIIRIVFGTNVIDSNSKKLPMILYSVLKKMYFSPRAQSIPLIDKSRMYIQISKNSWFWVKLNSSTKLSYEFFDLSTVSYAILLVDLKSGAHGRVWLCCDNGGNVFIMKFSTIPNKEKAYKALSQEASMWKQIWKLNAKVVIFNEEWCILMPYLATATEADWRDHEFISSVRESIQLFASKNLVHMDLHKRHVGKYYKN
ncbi:hypothetical protein DLAC_05650 [Tieghemostelium lacteum]|uniref:DUF5898 domain-containing protein n=1 Tax=Tieghemostelium lacteum TaxID=361077 RepID=A0A151ZGE2_TIELA|nr:hypothetical protein DLAC_05650 [Tieghemostelium lacteum]|eukprot:KYQ93041.1 hypothetical protein DLAC_05650 [Tieghemostelium lacteum]